MSNGQQPNFSDALEAARAEAHPGEELKAENFNRVDAGGFEAAAVLLQRWTDMIVREMFQNKKLRIEINYDAEQKKTRFAIYTPITSERHDSQEGCPDS